MQQKSIPPASLQWRVTSEGVLVIRINLTSKILQVEHPHLVASEEEEQVYFATEQPDLIFSSGEDNQKVYFAIRINL